MQSKITDNTIKSSNLETRFEHQNSNYDILLKGIEDKISNISTSTNVLFDNSNSLNYKVQTTITHVMDSLTEFQELFHEKLSKITSANLDIWSEIKALHLKSDLNVKFFDSVKTTITDHDNHFCLYKERQALLEEAIKGYTKNSLFNEFKLAMNRELTNMKISVNSKLKQISQGKKKIKYLDTENTEIVANIENSNKDKEKEKEKEKAKEKDREADINPPSIVKIDQNDANSFEEQTYKFLEKLNGPDQNGELKTSRVDNIQNLSQTNNAKDDNSKTTNQSHGRVKYAMTKEKFKTSEHETKSKLEDNPETNLKINTTRHISRDRIISPRSPGTIERINSAKFLADVNEQTFFGEEELSQINADIHSF